MNDTILFFSKILLLQRIKHFFETAVQLAVSKTRNFATRCWVIHSIQGWKCLARDVLL